MSDSGKLIFPVRFDLERAVEGAMGNADRVLQRLQTAVNNKPIVLSFDTSRIYDIRQSPEVTKMTSEGIEVVVHEKGSIAAIRKEMEGLVRSWNELSEAGRIYDQTSGSYTQRAHEILNRFTELTAATQSYAKGLSDIVRQSRQAEKEEQRRAEKEAAHKAALSNSANSVKDAAYALDFYRKKLNEINQFKSDGSENQRWVSLAGYVQNLATRLEDLKNRTQEATVSHNKLRQEEEKAEQAALAARQKRQAEAMRPIEQERAARQRLIEQKKAEIAILNGEEATIAQVNRKLQIRQRILQTTDPNSSAFRRNADEIVRLNEVLDRLNEKMRAALAKDVASMPEKSIAQVMAKIQAYRTQMQNSDFGSAEFNNAMLAASNLTGKLERMNKVAADREAWRVFREAMAAASDTMEGLNTRLSAYQTRMNSLSIGTREWLDAAQKVAQYSRELQRATQFASDFQQKAFAGLSPTGTPTSRDARVLELQQLRMEIERCDEAYNKLNASGRAYDTKGNLTPDAVNIIREKAEYTKKVAEMTADADKALGKYEQAERRAAESHRQRLEALKKLRDALNANEQRMANLNAKLQSYQNLIQKQHTGSDAWNKSANQIRRLSEELARVNQRMLDFQQKAFAGLSDGFVKSRVDELQRLRAELDAIDRRFNSLYQNGRATNADGSWNDRTLALLDERTKKEKEIANILRTAADEAVKREQQLLEIAEKRKQALAEMRRKESEHDAAKGERRAFLEAQKRFKLVNGMTQEKQKQDKFLKAELNSIDIIRKKLDYYQQKLQNQRIGPDGSVSKRFVDTTQKINDLTVALERAERKAGVLAGTIHVGAGRSEFAYNRITQAIRNQTTYVERLIKRLALYASVGALGNMLSKIRETTAQFELQRVSLGAIIQDQTRANQLFSEIKQFALKSPVSVLDLTKYTKQVAAYRIETDRLFDTTKRLADISVGLGVDMGRITLAYGQVRAATYLRAAEVRQFTEAGIPMLELLAEKLSKVNHQMVTTDQVMDMISRREVDFKMVDEIFTDMTSAGGMFYNMQERQGNTLYGLWQKLGDAASIMYDEIGNTGMVNGAMKSLIQSATSLMRNWRSAAAAGGIMVAGLMLMMSVQKLYSTGMRAREKAEKRLQAAIERRKAAENMVTKAELGTDQKHLKKAKKILANAQEEEEKARNAQGNMLTRNTYKAGFMSMGKSLLLTAGWTAALAALGTFIYKLGEALEASSRLARKLNEIKDETVALQSQSVRNFERLAKKAVSEASGSKAQSDALEELKRTYKDILPEEDLRIENLSKMAGHYERLTQAIRDYINYQQKQKAVDTINEEEGTVQTEMQKKLREVMKNKYILGSLAMSDHEINLFFEKFADVALDTSKDLKEQFIEAFRLAGLSGGEELWRHILGPSKDWVAAIARPFIPDDLTQGSALLALSQSYRKQNDMIAEQAGLYDSLNDTYVQNLKNYQNYVNDHLKTSDTFLNDQENTNMRIKAMISMISQALPQMGIAWNEAWVDVVNSIDPKDLNRISTINMDAILSAIDPAKYPQLHKYIEYYQKLYNGLVPQDDTVRQIWVKMMSIAESTGAGMDTMRRFLWDGSGTIDDHIKKLNEQIDQYKASLKKMQTTVANSGLIGRDANMVLKTEIEDTQKTIEDTQKTIEALEKIMEFEKTYTIDKEKKSKGSGKQDTRLQTLQEINQTLEKINKEYDDLRKKEGSIKALEDIRTQFRNTLDYTNKIGRKFGLKFDFPVTFESLQKYRSQILKAMKGLKNLKGGEKAILDFETLIGKADSDHLQQQIERQLKVIADRISRTKSAREFYQSILDLTGDYSLAEALSRNVYETDGFGLSKQIAEQIRAYFGRAGLEANIPVSVIAVDGSVNFSALEKYAEEMKESLGEDVYNELIKLARDGQKELAKTYEGYFKDLEKAKDYAAKRIELARATAEKIRQIEADMRAGRIDTATGSSLIDGFRKKEEREGAQLELEAFKETPLYVQMFQNLEQASSVTLRTMRDRLNALSGLWASSLNPTQLKELQSRMEEIDVQLRERNPFRSLKLAYEEYRNAVKDFTPQGAGARVGQASENLFEMTSTYGKDSAQAKSAEKELRIRKQIFAFSESIADAEGRRLKGAKALEALQIKSNDHLQVMRGHLALALEEERELVDAAVAGNRNPETDPAVIAAHKRVEDARIELEIAQAVADIIQTTAQKQKNLRESLIKAANQAIQFLSMASDLSRAVADTMSALGADELDVAFFNDIAESLSDITSGLQGIVDAAASLNVAGVISNAIGVIPNMVKGFVGLFSAGKVRKANKEIRTQEQLLERLENAYSRLEKMAGNLFGSDFIFNYNQQLSIMQAEAEAYRIQAEAEKSKGKKADKAKITEYENQWREALDRIEDRQRDVSSRMLGSDIAGAARDFAQAWLEAYKSFSKTSDKMSEKFRDMVENMVVEGVMARIMQQALQPMFDMIDQMGAYDFYSSAFWKDVAEQARSGAEAANYGAMTVMKFLEQAGINIRETGSSLTGISREYASASEESINGLAAATNTGNYYVSQILREVQYLRKNLGADLSRDTPVSIIVPVELLELERQGLTQLSMIERNTAATVIECRNIASACRQTLKYMDKFTEVRNGKLWFRTTM